jgi:hypothetical protein
MKMSRGLPYYQQRLLDELATRVERRPSYSLRAFARSLKTDPGSLSRVLSGKKVPSYPFSQKIFQILSLSPDEQERFLASVTFTRKVMGYQRFSPSLKPYREQATPAPRELSAEAFRVISDWYHFAILELTFVPGFRAEPAWIARSGSRAPRRGSRSTASSPSSSWKSKAIRW